MKIDIKELVKQRVVILDGAMGTQLQNIDIPQDAWIFNNEEKEGCNELLNFTAPQIIQSIHENYLKSGADLIKTNSFGSFPWVLEEYNLADQSYALAKASAQIAKKAINNINPNAYILGSIGPGTKLPSLGHITYDEMFEGYKPCVEGLLDGGAEIFLLETCQDPLQIKAGINAINSVLEERNLHLPIMVSVTIETNGCMLIGTDAETIATILEPYNILSLGFNCGSGPDEVLKHVKTLSENYAGYISVHANAGLPINMGGCTVYPMQPTEFSHLEKNFLNYNGVSFVGGCCGTSPEHIKALKEAVKGIIPKPPIKEPKNLKVASLFSTVDLKQNPSPLLIGERSNATGSKIFRELLLAENYEEAVNIATGQIKCGAHVLDVNVGFAGRDEKKDMTEIVTRYSKLPIPLMPDSTQLDGLKTALKLIGGKAIINSANLEDGEERFAKICNLAKKYGACLICLTIDEKGMAKTKERKLEVAERMFDLATKKHGIKPANIMFDFLTFTIGSGDEEYYNAGIDLIESIREIQIRHPEVSTTLGLSNISFGLSKDARIFLNSVFLSHCIDAGLTSAIVNVMHILPLNKISAEDKKACDDLIFNRRTPDFDPLFAFIEHFKDATAQVFSVSDEEFNKLSDEEKIKTLLMDGDKNKLVEIIKDAQKTIPPEKIVNEILIDAMRVVGELFGKGEMQLPFVLQSAECMKFAVDYLNPFLPKTEKTTKTTLILGTVKGDVHDVGKNLVDIILTNNGFKIVNIGIKATIEDFIKAYKDYNADAIGMSGLLVKSTNEMKNNLAELKKHGISAPIILGGAALSKSFVDDYCRVEYDGVIFYCRDAFDGIIAMTRIEKAKNDGKPIDPYFKSDHTSCAEKILCKNIINVENSEVSEKEFAEEIEKFKLEDVILPQAPFYGVKQLKIGEEVSKETIFDWINKSVLFKARWGYKDYDDKFLNEFLLPKFEELKKLFIEGDFYNPIALYGFYKCKSNDTTLIINHENKEYKIEFPRQNKAPYRCVADFFSSTKDDVVAFSLASSGLDVEKFEKEIFKNGEYANYNLIHGLVVELAESLAEVVHKIIRIKLNILQNETAKLSDINMKNYQGKRYSPGYPACPNLEINKTIFELLQPEKYGITLNENFFMNPEATTVAIIAHHKEAVYYSV